jgi:signal transduction histidine kinase
MGRARAVPEIPEGSTDDDFVREILDRYAHRLGAEGNALIRDPQSFDEVLRQARLIIGDTLARIGGQVGAAEPAPVGSEFLSVEIGTIRAKTGVHPIESLRAAALLYEVALPVLLSRRGMGADDRVATVSVVLYEEVMDRIALASLSYVDFLVDKLRASRQEERLRIARELHDRVGHSMALTLQSLDLFQHYASHDPESAEPKLYEALTSLTEAMQTVQEMSAELRRSVDKAGAEDALRAYMRANVPPNVIATLDVRGDAKLLLPSVSEELYLILREATRNALRHADASEIRLRMEISDDTVVASVTDDGRGFQVETVLAMPTGGLPSMMERAELLRGDLSVTSRPSAGTTVRVTVPLDRRSL